jgi:hypothetical protein
MHCSLKKALGQAAPQRFAFPVRGFGLAHVAVRRLPVVPCAAFHATGAGSALPSARLAQPAGGPQRALTSLRPAPLSRFSTNSFPTDFAVGRFGVLCTGLIAGTALTGLYFDWQKKVETSETKRKRLEVEAILAARAPPSLADKLNRYVKRAELEETLLSFVQKPIIPGGSYMVVFGPRGAGKMTLVSHVLKEMDDGVLFVLVTDVSAEQAGLEGFVLNAALNQYEPPKESVHANSTPVKSEALAERLKAAANAHRENGEKDWRPTLVLEIDQTGGHELINDACRLLKRLTSDMQLCHGILVLSSSSAVAVLPSDDSRQRFLRVGAFSRGEASAYLKANLKEKLPENVATSKVVDDVSERFLQLTTLPQHAINFTEDMLGSKTEDEFRARAEAWASKLEEAARKDVERAAKINVFNTLLTDETGKAPLFATCDLMRELLDTGAPVNLPNARFDVPSDMFAARIRESKRAKKAFDVDLVSDTVDFASGAHRKAATELLPPSLWSWLFGGRV